MIIMKQPGQASLLQGSSEHASYIYIQFRLRFHRIARKRVPYHYTINVHSVTQCEFPVAVIVASISVQSKLCFTDPYKINRTSLQLSLSIGHNCYLKFRIICALILFLTMFRLWMEFQLCRPFFTF